MLEVHMGRSTETLLCPVITSSPAICASPQLFSQTKRTPGPRTLGEAITWKKESQWDVIVLNLHRELREACIEIGEAFNATGTERCRCKREASEVCVKYTNFLNFCAPFFSSSFFQPLPMLETLGLSLRFQFSSSGRSGEVNFDISQCTHTS